MKYSTSVERAVGAIKTARFRIAQRLTDPSTAFGKRARLLSRQTPLVSPRVRKSVVLGAAGVSLALAAYGVKYHFETVAYENALKASSQAIERQANAAQALQQLDVRAGAIGNLLKREPLGSATRMMRAVSPELDRVRSDAIVGVPVALTRDSCEDIRPYIDKANRHLDAAMPVLTRLGKSLSDVENLLEANRRLQATITSPAYQAARSRFAAAAAMERDALRAIDEADAKGVTAGVAAVDRIVATVRAEQISALDEASERVAVLSTEFSLLALAAPDRARVDAALAAAQDAVDAMDAVTAQRRIKLLGAMLDFAKAPLTVRVSLQSGQPAVFARAYVRGGASAEPSSGYFVLAEAVDASGQAVAMPVTSADTEFAVQISMERYAELLKPASSTTLPALGDKPANSLMVRYIGAISDQPDVLLK